VIDLLSHDAITVQVRGIGAVVPYASAARWSAAVTGPQGIGGTLMRLATPDTRDTLTQGLLYGDLTADDVFTASHDAIRLATGRSWWASARLLGLGSDSRTLGAMVLAGVDPWALTAGQWCAAIYTLHTQNQKAEDVFKFDALLNDPPAGEVDEWGDDDYEAAVQAARSLPGMK
jgi:hypothetical protein